MENNIRNRKKTNNRAIIDFMFKGSKKYFVVAMIAMILSIAAQYTAPLITSFTIDYVIGDKALNAPDFIKNIINSIGDRDFYRNNLYICAIAFIGIYIINSIGAFFRGSSVSVASERIAKRLRDRLFYHLQSLPYDYFKHASTGDLIQRCTSDVRTVVQFISVQLLDIIRITLMFVIACIIMFSMNVRMALVSVVTLPILFISSFVYFGHVQKNFVDSDEAEGKLSAVLQENLTGVRVVRAFGQQKNEIDKFTQCNADYRDKTYKLTKLMANYWSITDAIGYLQILITLCVGAYYTVTSDFTLGELVAFTTYSSLTTWPVRQLGRILSNLGKTTVALGRINEILDSEPEEEPGAALKPEIEGNIEFKNVCFGYDSYNDVLDDISFTVKKGEMVAILGSTGSGKTSLVQLLQRLYKCTRGEIIIDGVNINDIETRHLRKNVGIVLQEPFLYSKTILENIKITNPDADNQEVYDAARTASLHDVVMEFENGYETVVGERGVTLSGGQKQRVAIARMLMQGTPILIFDDSLSAVDTETDAAIQTALNERNKNTTTFIISHRITTLCKADKIIVLDNGKIVDIGTHNELIQHDGLYKRAAEIQNLVEDDFMV